MAEDRLRRQAQPRWDVGYVPTGSYTTSEGSSVETEEDVATEEVIPTTEEIVHKAEGRGGTGKRPSEYPAQPHAPSGGLAGGAAMLPDRKGETPQEAEGKPRVPHNKGMGTSKE